MSSLKDALKKAGLRSTKSVNERESAKGRVKQQSEKHQETRNFCEVCELIQPDVEKYKHRNPTVDAEWICAACADREQIHDQFRVTHQSDFAKKGRFRREFGPTLDPKQNSKSGRPQNRNANGNQKRHHHSKNRGGQNGNRGGSDENFNR